MVVLDKLTYNKIIEYLNNYRGISIECEKNVVQLFPDLPHDTIRSIISRHGQILMRNCFYKLSSRTEMIVRE
jgi:hypothetical protein